MGDQLDEQDLPRKRVRLDDNGETSVNSENGVTSRHDIDQQLEQERKFGISAFVTDKPGFVCVLKQRYTDFLVNEIQLSGQVVHLEKSHEKPKQQSSSLTTSSGQKDDNANVIMEEKISPTKPAKSLESQSEPSKPESSANPPNHVQNESPSISDDDKAVLAAIFDEETVKFTITLFGKILAHPHRKAKDHPQHTSKAVDDKQNRTEAHTAVRRIFNGRIETSTLDGNVILIKASTPNSGRPRGNADSTSQLRGKAAWSDLGGEYLHFTLYKENKDTMEVLYFIASQLKLHIKNFQFAGTKDRRGVTVQRVSTYRTTQDKISSINPRLRGSRVSGFEHHHKGLELGELAGNEFTIVLRDCQSMSLGIPSRSLSSTIASAVDSFRERGFLNYFGLQRFGSFAISTDEVGKFMLQGNLQSAVDSILALPDASSSSSVTSQARVSTDDIARTKALTEWHSTHKSSATLLEQLPRKFQAEYALIRHLGQVDRKTSQMKNANDWQGALMGIARNLRLMYVHAYQSRIWNEVVGKRWEMYGSTVIEGDLVIINSDTTTTNGQQDKFVINKDDNGEEVDEQGEVIVRPAIHDSAVPAEEKFIRARPLTKEEAECGRFTIFDVVLPLPGYDVVYPSNDISQVYHDVMGKAGLDPNDMRRKWKDISLSGSYRKVMARAKKVSHEIVEYVNDDEQLVLTDLDRLNGKTELNIKTPEGVKTNTALVVKLQLGSSQYATMALRELTNGGAISYKPDYAGR